MLRDEIRIKDERMVEESRSNQVKIDVLEREKQSLHSKISALELQLSSVPSPSLFETMKRELRILKRLQYNAADDVIDDDVDTDRDPEIAGGSVSIGGSNSDENDIEAVLVNKLRRVEKELITERNLRSELSETMESLKESLSLTERAKLECEQLVASLEKDLERAIVTPKASQSKHIDINRSVQLHENPSALEQILDPSAASPPPSLSPSKPEPTRSSTEKAEDDHSVATIVMAQRDRLRARCEALEAERDSFKRELQGQVQAAESLKADNTKLYEKVRFLQNFSKGSTTTSKASGASGLYHRSTSVDDRDLDLEALEQRYEASVDPFKQFSKSERQRKLDEMSPMERTVFVVAKTVLCTYDVCISSYSLIASKFPLTAVAAFLLFLLVSHERDENRFVFLCPCAAFACFYNHVSLVGQRKRM
jgi:homeobox protein cut-like